MEVGADHIFALPTFKFSGDPRCGWYKMHEVVATEGTVVYPGAYYRASDDKFPVTDADCNSYSRCLEVKLKRNAPGTIKFTMTAFALSGSTAQYSMTITLVCGNSNAIAVSSVYPNVGMAGTWTS